MPVFFLLADWNVFIVRSQCLEVFDDFGVSRKIPLQPSHAMQPSPLPLSLNAKGRTLPTGHLKELGPWLGTGEMLHHRAACILKIWMLLLSPSSSQHLLSVNLCV